MRVARWDLRRVRCAIPRGAPTSRQHANPTQDTVYDVPALQNEHGYGEVSTRLSFATALALEAARLTSQHKTKTIMNDKHQWHIGKAAEGVP